MREDGGGRDGRGWREDGEKQREEGGEDGGRGKNVGEERRGGREGGRRSRRGCAAVRAVKTPQLGSGGRVGRGWQPEGRREEGGAGSTVVEEGEPGTDQDRFLPYPSSPPTRGGEGTGKGWQDPSPTGQTSHFPGGTDEAKPLPSRGWGVGVQS